MNDFETHKIQFKKRSTFNLALEILKKQQDDIFNTYQTEDSSYDVGYADMIISFASKVIMDAVIGDLAIAQIWDKPSKLKGEADFEIIS